MRINRLYSIVPESPDEEAWLRERAEQSSTLHFFGGAVFVSGEEKEILSIADQYAVYWSRKGDK